MATPVFFGGICILVCKLAWGDMLMYVQLVISVRNKDVYIYIMNDI